MTDEEKKDGSQRTLVKTAAFVGAACLLLSSMSLYVSTTYIHSPESGSEVALVLWLMAARLCGIAAFACGVVAMVQQSWTIGTFLFIGSLGLPCVSIFIHGSP